MKNLIQVIEETLDAIKPSELRKNPKASAKALEIKQMIADLKSHSKNRANQGVLKFINPKMLLEN